MKSVKKLLALVLAIAVVATFALPVLAVEMTAAEKCATLKLLKGDGSGVTEAYLAKTSTRLQSAIISLRLAGKEAEALAYTGTATFTDAADVTWQGGRNVLAYLKANPDLGWGGYPDGSFKPNAATTAQMFYKVMLEGLGYKQGTDFEWSEVIGFAKAKGFEDAITASPFTNDDMAAALVETLGMNVKGDDEITLIDQLIEDGVVTQEDAAAAGLVAPVTLAIDSISVLNLNKVEAKLNMAVDTSKAVVKVKKGAVVYVSTATWNEAKDTVTVQTAANLPASDYTVEVSGLTDTAVTKAFTVAAAVETTIAIKTTQVYTGSAVVAFEVKDQFGNVLPVYSDTAGVVASAYNVNKKAAAALTPVAGKAQYDLAIGAPAEVNNVFRVTITYKALTVQSNVTLIEAPAAASIAFGAVAPLTDKTRISVGDAGLEIPYSLVDQYGVAFKMALHNAADGDANIETISGVKFLSSNENVVDVDSFRVDADGKLTFTAGGTAGTAKITAIIDATGFVTTLDIKVEAAGAATSAVVSSPTAIVAAPEVVTLDMVVTDQYGSVLANDSAAVTALTYSSSAQAVIKDADIKLKNKKLEITTTGAGTAVVSVKAGTTVIGTISITVEAAAVATNIVGVTFPALFEASTAATSDMTYDSVSVIDQYGRAFTLTTEQINVVAKDGTANIITIDAANFSGAGNVTFGGTATAGSEVFTISINGVAGSSFEVTLGTVATADIVTYELAAVGTIYKSADAAYHKALTLTGKTSSGAVVALAAGKITSYTSSNAAIAKITAGKVEGVAAGTATIAVWNGATKLAEVAVTVSDAAPVATTIAFSADTLVIDGKNAADALAAIKAALSIKDQYGVAIAPVGGTNGLWTSSTAATITFTADAITTYANGTTTVGFVTNNGIVDTIAVTVSNKL